MAHHGIGHPGHSSSSLGHAGQVAPRVLRRSPGACSRCGRVLLVGHRFCVTCQVDRQVGRLKESLSPAEYEQPALPVPPQRTGTGRGQQPG